MSAAPGPIAVVAAVAVRDGAVLLCQRAQGDHLPGKWEFPGGKVEAGEAPRAALARELREELGVDAVVGSQVAEARHAYPNKSVWLRFFDVELRGEPRPIVHRQLRWVALEELDGYDVPPPNRVMVARLSRRGKTPSKRR